MVWHSGVLGRHIPEGGVAALTSAEDLAGFKSVLRKNITMPIFSFLTTALGFYIGPLAKAMIGRHV